jgi:hypothetical protein
MVADAVVGAETHQPLALQCQAPLGQSFQRGSCLGRRPVNGRDEIVRPLDQPPRGAPRLVNRLRGFRATFRVDPLRDQDGPPTS